MKVFIAIDDTDNETSIGTGRLSRMLAQRLTQGGLIADASVTRHQLLVHPDIPYTSHNSSACIEALADGPGTEEIARASRDFLLEHFHEGANPGLCVSESLVVPRELLQFGRRAQSEVLKIEEAKELVQRFNLTAWWYGETGQGCIGALSGVGLRSGGSDGRFIELQGIREIEGALPVGEILARTRIHRVETVSGGALGSGEIVDTGGWLRPSLVNGRAVLQVFQEGDLWRPAGKRENNS